MKAFSFTSNVLAAGALSVGGAAVHAVLLPLLGRADAGRMLLLIVSLGYLLFLVQRCAPRFGLSLMLSGWILIASMLLLFNPPLSYWLLSQVFVLWLVRSALRYPRLHNAMVDAALSMLALCCGVSVLLYTRSWLLGMWSYFLVQAFCVWIPARNPRYSETSSEASTFYQAQSSAEDALRRLQRNSR